MVLGLKKILLAVILTFTYLFSYAEIESGAYLTGFVGYGYVSNGTGYLQTNNVSYSLGLSGGYAFNKYFGLDGGVTFMPNTYQNQSSDYFLTDVAIRASVPLGSFASAYLHVGPGLLFNNQIPANNNQLGVFLGLGALFQVSHHIGINVEDYGIYIPGNKNSDINILALGLTYAF